MKEYKFDVFKALVAVDKKDGDWFSKQPEDVRKAFAPPILMRYASAISGDGMGHEYMLSMVNKMVNIDADVIMSQHPELFFRLSAACGIGKKQNHIWIPGSKRDKKSNKSHEILEKFHPTANAFEIEMLLSKHTKESFKEFVEGAGLTPEETKQAIKDFGK